VLVSAKMYIHDLIKVIAKIIQNKVLDIHLKKKENPYGDYKNDNSIQRTDKKIKAILMIYRNMFKKITQIITPKWQQWRTIMEITKCKTKTKTKKINLVFFKNNSSLEFNQQVPFYKKPESRTSKNPICKLEYYSTNQR